MGDAFVAAAAAQAGLAPEELRELLDRDAKLALTSAKRQRADGGSCSSGGSDLPPGWVEARDPRYDNTTYYVDTRTRETSWTRPESRERLPPPLPATPAMPSYVRLRGLPFQATELDVAQWFFSAPAGSITIGSVHFIYNNTGRKSGEAVSAPPSITSVPDPHSHSRLPFPVC